MRLADSLDDLIVACLERRAKRERDAIAGARQSAGDVPDAFRILARAIGAETCRPGFRGCPFINAAAEYAGPGHPVRRVVDAHRRWFRQAMQDLLDEISSPNSARVADQLVLLRDGAMVSGYLSDPAPSATPSTTPAGRLSRSTQREPLNAESLNRVEMEIDSH